MPAADGSLPLDPDSTLPFFFLDAHEDAVRIRNGHTHADTHTH